MSSLTKSTVQYIIKEIGKEEHREQIVCYIVEPIFTELKNRIFPYFASLISILTFLVILMIILTTRSCL